MAFYLLQIRIGGQPAPLPLVERPQNAPQSHEECRREENIYKEEDKKKYKDYDEEDKDDDARCCTHKLARQAEVVGGSGYRVDIPAGRAVQKGRCGDCQEPGFEEGFAEGAIVGDADADVLCEPRGQEPVEEPAARAGACEGASARADREDEERWRKPRCAAHALSRSQGRQGGRLTARREGYIAL